MSDPQFNKLKLAIKNDTEVTFHEKWSVILMMNLISHISYYQLLQRFQAFENGSSANIKFSII